MRRSALLLVPLALVLAGCGSGDASAPSASGDPAGTESADAGRRVLDVSTCQDAAALEKNPESCYAAYSPADNGPVLVARGTGFPLVDFEDPAFQETMTVRGAECGLAELSGGVPDEDRDGSGTTPGTPPLRPDPGMTFCRVVATWQNTGSKPLVGWTDFERLIAADGTEYAADEVAAEATQRLNECSPSSCGTIEPGAPALDVVKIYQLPEGTQPASVRWSRATPGTGPGGEFPSSGPVVEFLLE